MEGYSLSTLAEGDLDEIYDYTFDRWGEEQFSIYQRQISGALEEISEDPMRRHSKARSDLVEGCRSYRVQEHYIFYRVQNDQVEIGRVLHGAMNFADHLSGEVF